MVSERMTRLRELLWKITGRYQTDIECMHLARREFELLEEELDELLRYDEEEQ